MIGAAGRARNWIVAIAAMAFLCWRKREGPAPRRGPGLRAAAGAGYCTSTARLSAIFCCQICGPVMCTDSPLASTATVTGMSLTSNS